MATRSKTPASNDRPDTMPPAVDEPSVKPARPRGARSQETTLPEEGIRAMIEREAYLRAERRGFEPGHEEEDWLAAEAQVRATLRGGGQHKH